ncbi:MAG: PmoA family protein [Phycisphaerae bacterium]|nr:PmoA family protein [Phycisphaerae bacterium]
MLTERTAAEMILLAALCAAWDSPRGFGQTTGMGRAENRLDVREDSGRVLLDIGGKPLLSYRHGGGLFKPYVGQWWLPDGRELLRDSAPDHKHHHGLMFAWNVDGVEFWGEEGKVGRQIVRKLEIGAPAAGTASAVTLVQVIDWAARDGMTVLLRERRTVSVPVDPKPADRLLVWRTEFSGPDAKKAVTLTGRKYLGLGARFPSSMDQGARFLTADGETDVARVNGSTSRWCAITGDMAPGKPATLAILDAGENPRAPATWFAMNQGFAYLSATIGLAEKPYVLKPGETLKLRYVVAAWSEPAGHDDVERAYRAWARAGVPAK